MISNREIQQFLVDKGFMSDRPDGIIGPRTKTAMRRYLDQQWLGRRLRVGMVQSICQDAGFSPGPIDGIMGPMTRGAVAAYEASKQNFSPDRS
jgi:peptidoglycan hydrolase-like protein with peptidoglycan-binding domain